MQTDASRLSALTTQWQQARNRLSQQPDASLLAALSLQLSQSRLASAPSDSTLLTASTDLAAALWRSELLFSLSSALNWPQSTVQLLVSAGYCCSLCDTLPGAQLQLKLQQYPPLLAAKLLPLSAAQPLSQLLTACYASERKIPYWRQQASSILLTLVMRFTPPTSDNSFTTQLANRIVLSRCEHELAMLRNIMSWLHQAESPARVTAETLFCHSDYQQLRHSSNKVLAVRLSITAAWRDPVLQLASELNRQQQQITDLALAINLIGRDLLDSVLIDAELNEQLSRLHHPQQAMLQQVTACFASCLYLLAGDSVNIAQSRALARCLCAPLWFDSSGYRLGLLRQDLHGDKPLPDFSLFHKAAAGVLISKLLLQYQLTDWQAPGQQFLARLRQPLTHYDNASLTLLIAWYSCQAVFTGVIPPALADLLPQHTANARLNITVQQWLTAVAVHSHSQCPLLLTL